MDSNARKSNGENSVSRVGPWKNKTEFDIVYALIYASDSDNNSKQLAIKRIKIWKIRRLNLTPASVLSTLSILEAQIKDHENQHLNNDDLQCVYSIAFTRFLNYMSSIMRGRRLDSMYLTARELGIESFLVDLRHLCAHGQITPSLHIFRRTSEYCLNWLREFYWDREREFIVDAKVRDVHLEETASLEKNASDWFTIYSAATEAMIIGCKTIDDCQDPELTKHIAGQHLAPLIQLAQTVHNNKLTFLSIRAINELAALSTVNKRDRGNVHIYCDLLINMPYFFNRSAQYYQSKLDQSRFIGLHQNLFRLFAICDFINEIFVRLVDICEDALEDDVRRKAASFWCTQIVVGFTIFNQFKNEYKAKKEKNANFELDMAPINTEFMTDELKRIYKKLNINCSGSLIFGDTVRRPWALHFDRDFLLQRCFNINPYTIAAVRKCIQLTQPPLKPDDIQQIEKMILIYIGDQPIESSVHADDVQKVYTIADLPESVNDDASNANSERQIPSIWKEAPEGLDWKSCPIGGAIP